MRDPAPTPLARTAPLPAADRAGAAPDYSHGYLRLPLAVWLDLYCRAPLTRRQLQLVSVVIRESWGWRNPRGGVYLWTRPLTSGHFAALTGLSTDHLAGELRRLVSSGVLRERDRRYQLVADSRLWITPARSAQMARLQPPESRHEAAQLTLFPPPPKKGKKGERNVPAVTLARFVGPVENRVPIRPSSPAASGPPSRVFAARLLAIVTASLDRTAALAPVEADLLLRWIGRVGVAPAWESLEALLRLPRSHRGPAVRALLRRVEAQKPAELR
jgi:hypothetical protein